MLAGRVRQLKADGVVVRRHLAPPAASPVYELAPAGDELARMPLARPGARHHTGDGRAPADVFRAEWALAPFVHLLPAEVVRGIDAVREFRIDGNTAHLRIGDGGDGGDGDGDGAVGPESADGRADAAIRSDVAPFASLVGGWLAFGEALAAGRARAEGGDAVQAALIALLWPVIEADGWASRGG
ncbi:hypothetical protein BTM25_17330 [Actinomadura rubteroloni]|uniref:Uncharacterized protein n=1 Tax=Actinomadura rubteroloni TaxID=1926885 RepID=A0A2P4UQK6_9ACTN|nr:hypothetical protein BTM25_17330 [Actinomadura rubteroloni]